MARWVFRIVMPITGIVIAVIGILFWSISDGRVQATTKGGAAAAVPAAELLKVHCLSCHQGDKAKAGFRVDRLLEASLGPERLLEWKDVLGRLEARDMPPKGKPRPTIAEYDLSAAAVRAALDRVESALDAKKPRPLRRLNRVEYANTIRDLFGIRYRPGGDFPFDDALHGFDTVAEGLIVSPALVERYLATASGILDRALRPDLRNEPRTTRYAFYEEHDRYPKRDDVRGFGIYNGNAIRFFGKDGKGKVLYIGGPAIFARDVRTPDSENAIGAEGVYKFKARLVPHKFEAGEVASFSVLDGGGRLVAERDVRLEPATKEVVIEAEAYADRSDSETGFELQWTNGNHLPWRNRKPPDPHPYAANYWFAVNHKVVAPGKWVEWQPKSPDEMPFSYFDKVEFEISGPHREAPRAMTEWLGSYLEDGDAAKVFERFLPRAFRRPVTRDEIDRYAKIVAKQTAAGLSRIDALKLGLSATLCSPHFLFLVETPPPNAAHGAYRLNPFELANRLSYFLWSSLPDAELMASAGADKLKEPAELAKQVKRMLADPKARALSDNFARQWLGLDKLASAMPEPKLFPDYSDDLRDASRGETLAFFHEVLTRDLPVTQFLDAKWTFANQKLAEHYGLPPVNGRVLRKIDLADGRRGGLLTQAAVLTLTSEATRTAPVRRGAYVLDRLFNRPPPPPPPNVGSLIPDASKARSVREHLAIHRADPACAGCHARFDHYGLVLESFDATGAWRTEEPAHEDPAKPVHRKEGEKLPAFKIDTVVEAPDGSSIDGVVGLKRHLLGRRGEFVRGLAERLGIYAAGRGLTVADRPAIDAIVQASAMNDDRFQSLIFAVISSPIFQTR